MCDNEIKQLDMISVAEFVAQVTFLPVERHKSGCEPAYQLDRLAVVGAKLPAKVRFSRCLFEALNIVWPNGDEGRTLE